VSSIVEDLLVIARADIGKVTLLPEVVSLGEQVDLVTQNLDPIRADCSRRGSLGGDRFLGGTGYASRSATT